MSRRSCPLLNRCRATALPAAATLLALTAQPARPASPARAIRRSVVKIYATIQRPDRDLPWESGRPGQGTGSGFIISRRRILTNAHVASDARFLQVQKDGDPKRYRARVAFFGHDCDLALLEVLDERFFEQTSDLAFGEDMPELNEEVTVVGYPMGGSRLSITRGVVSRIDYSLYSHSGVDQHLVLQVDAAINPGNSGGPVIQDGRLVGLAFQVHGWGENLGYAIPLPVINHFLEDVADGTYHGYPELGAGMLDSRNPALRAALGLSGDRSGAAVYYVDPFGSAKGHLRPGDILLSVDRHPIAADGTIELEGNNVMFEEILERKQWGDSVAFEVLRDGGRRKLTVPLQNPPDPFVFRRRYNRQPRYFILGGLVFAPLDRAYLDGLKGRLAQPNAHLLAYYAQYAKRDGLSEDRQEFVVLVNRLPHPVNTYADAFRDGIVEEINGTVVRDLEDLARAADQPRDGFHLVRFAGQDDELVLDARRVSDAQDSILETYGVPAASRLGEAQ